MDTDWIPPEVPDLRLYCEDGHWLCLNPEVPAWFLTNRVGALILELADGRRSIEELHELLISNHVSLGLPQLVAFFAEVCESKFYSSGTQESVPWRQRTLTALHLHLTNRCNLRCTYCFRESHPDIPLRSRASDFTRMLVELKPYADARFEVTFTGGEPLLFPGFKEVVIASAELGYDNILLTNGTLIDEELADFIAGRFTDITISLDGPTDELHASQRGRGTFRRTLRGIELLAARNANVTVKMTVTRSNLACAGDLQQALPVQVAAQFTPLLPMGRGARLDDEFIDNQAFLALNAELKRGDGDKPDSVFIPARRRRACHAGTTNLSVDDSGDVYPCHLFHYPEFRLGNVFEDSIDEIFFGEKLRRFASSMDVEANNPVCRACDLRYLCAGGCKANALHATGDYRGVDLYCAYLKQTILDQLVKQCSTTICQERSESHERCRS